MNAFHLGQVAYCEVKKVVINTYNHFTLDLTQFESPKVHYLSFRDVLFATLTLVHSSIC
jgi:hypothetical protein